MIERFLTNAKRLQFQIEHLIGLDLFVRMEDQRLPTETTVCIPNGTNSEQFIRCFGERYEWNINEVNFK